MSLILAHPQIQPEAPAVKADAVVAVDVEVAVVVAVGAVEAADLEVMH
jgi:hypothetical protein